MFFASGGWITTMEQSGDATLALVGYEWSILSNNRAPAGGTDKLMATAAKECTKLGLHPKVGQ